MKSESVIKVVLGMLLVLLSAQVVYAQSGDFPIVFDRLKVEDGLSYRGINDITQDDRGFMWFATSEGLNRYDGISFKVYKHARADLTSLSCNHVEVVLQDNQNADILWVAPQDGLNKFDRRTETFTRYFHDPDDANSLAGNNIYELMQDAAGLLWIGTEDSGMDRFDPTTETFTHFRHDPNAADSLSGNNINRHPLFI